MKKFLLLAKLYCVVAFSGLVCSQVSAQITPADLAGTYQFTADFTLEDNGYEGLYSGNSIVTIEAGSRTVSVSNFVGFDHTWNFTVESESNTISCNDLSVGTYGTTIVFSNTEGINPWGTPRWDFEWTVEDENTITIPDFTIVDVIDWSFEKSPIVLARFSNAKLTRIETPEPEPGDFDFAGTYTVTGDPYDWEASTYKYDQTFTLKIVKSGEGTYDITEMAGFTVPDNVYGGYGVTAKANGNTLTISPVGNTWLTYSSPFYKLGGLTYSTTDYNSTSDDSITLTYENGKWTLSGFTVWTVDYSSGMVYDQKYYWGTISSVTKEGTSSVEPSANFAGTYTVSGGKTDYTGASPSYSPNQSFTLKIEKNENGKYDVTEIAGYTVPEVYGACGVSAKVTGNTLTIEPVSGTYLSLGAVYDVLGNYDYTQYNKDGAISLTYSDGAWKMDDFSVWQATWITGAEYDYDIKAFWSSLSVTQTATGVENAVVEPVAKVVVNGGNIVILGDYSKASIVDFSGRVIALDAKASTSVNAGLYIVVVDGKATKVLVH